MTSRLLLGMAALCLSAVAQAQTVTARVLMETEMGPIEIELYGDNAPITVTNFLRYVDGGHYDGAEFYRVVDYGNDNGSPIIEVIQGGLNEAESPFPPVAHETTAATGILHTDGVLSMARGEVGTASSEFFITIGRQPGLDFGQPRNADGQGFAAFGRVTSGMEVVRAINNTGDEAVGGSDYTAGQILLEPVQILSASRI